MALLSTVESNLPLVKVTFLALWVALSLVPAAWETIKKRCQSS